MRDPIQIRLSGAGGQGLITAGVILAEAALLDGLNVVQTQSYGPEARLGASKSEVILSRNQIAYPQVTEPDVLLCLSQQAVDKYLPQAEAHTVVVLDATLTRTPQEAHPFALHPLPITATAERVGSRVVANVVALGAINALLGLVSPADLKAAVLKRVPERFRELNERALTAGVKLVTQRAAPPNPKGRQDEAKLG